MTSDAFASTDLVALVLIVLMAVIGAIRGAIRIVIGVAALLVGVALAGRYASALPADKLPGMSDDANIGMAVSSLLILVGTLLIGALLGRMLRRAAQHADFGRVDRFLGFLLGAVKGAIYAALLILLLLGFGPEEAQADVADSYALVATRRMAEAVEPILPENLRDQLGELLGTATSNG